MHGFFVLPPEVNRQEANRMGALLIELATCCFFTCTSNYHFYQHGSFTGRWGIHNAQEWEEFHGESKFDILSKRVQLENDPAFWENTLADIQTNIEDLEVSKIINTLLEHENGAMAIWIHPKDMREQLIFRQIIHQIEIIPDAIVISLTLHDTGISFTSDFILKRLVDLLVLKGCKPSSKKKIQEQVALMRAQWKGRVIIFVNRLQVALFSKQHVVQLSRFFSENRIHFIALSHKYEFFINHFNIQYKLEYATSVPNPQTRSELLHNYLRFKGPFSDREEDKKNYDTLADILDKLCEQLQSGKRIYARRFADAYGYELEFVHECFAMLHPWINQYREAFEEDTVDEIYGYPVNITETTPIYLSLGRRDVKLEYKHKVISL
jgi:hypothetical protein